MNRRGFLKSIGVGIAAISGLGVIKPRKIPKTGVDVAKGKDYTGSILVKNIEPFEILPDDHETHVKTYSDWRKNLDEKGIWRVKFPLESDN